MYFKNKEHNPPSRGDESVLVPADSPKASESNYTFLTCAALFQKLYSSVKIHSGTCICPSVLIPVFINNNC